MSVKSIPSPKRFLAELTAVSCPSASRCEAIGFSETSLGDYFSVAEGNMRP